MPKKIEFDIVGHDKASKAFDKVGDSAGRLKGSLGKVGGVAQSVLRPIAAVSAAGSTLASVTGPVAAGLAHVAVAGAHVAVTLAPLAATVPGLAGSFLLLSRTASIVGPSMAEALVPIPNYITKIEAPVARLAAKGLTKLADQFVKVSGPTIATGMERIAKASNTVAVGFGKWVNSVPGQRVVASIVKGTAAAAEQAAPHITAAAIAIGNLAGRAGNGIFPRLGNLLVAAADGAKRLADSVSTQDIHAAFAEYDRLAGVIGGLPAKLSALRGEIGQVTAFWRDNAAAITEAHLALTGIAIVAGILTGQWLPALAAGGSLLATNYQAVAGVGDQISASFHRLVGSSQFLQDSIAGLTKLWHSWSDVFAAGMKQVGPLIEPLLPELAKFGAALSETFRLSLPFIRVFGAVVAKVLVAAVATFVLASIAATNLATSVVTGFNLLLKGVALAVKGVLHFVGTLIGGLGSALASIPGPFHDMGVQMQHAAAEVHAQARAVQGFIDGIHGKTVSVNVVTNYKTGTGTPSGPLKVGYRASGGPVEAGRPYVVGEAGRELFVPKSDGTIVPAPKTKAMLARTGGRAVTGGGSAGGDTHLHLHNHGVIGSQIELQNWLVKTFDAAQKSGRLRVRTP